MDSEQDLANIESTSGLFDSKWIVKKVVFGENKHKGVYYTILYYTILYYTILYYTILCLLIRGGGLVCCKLSWLSEVRAASAFSFIVLIASALLCLHQRSCHILPFQPILWNRYLPSEPVKTDKNSPPSISEGGRVWQVWSMWLRVYVKRAGRHEISHTQDDNSPESDVCMGYSRRLFVLPREKSTINKQHINIEYKSLHSRASFQRRRANPRCFLQALFLVAYFDVEIHVCVCIYIYIYVYTCMCINLSLSLYIYIYIHMYV